MSKRKDHPLVGKWRITSMELWDDEYINMMGPGYIQIDEAGGTMSFGVVEVGLRCEYGTTSVWFRFRGSSEMDEVSGEGDAELEEDGSLSGEICFDEGDESAFTAKPW